MSNPQQPPFRLESPSFGTVNNVIQPNQTITEDGRGLLEGSVSIRYTVDPKSPSLPTIPRLGDPHPYDGRLKCYKSSSQFGNNGMCVITASYIGLTQDPTIAETETSGSTSETSMVFHPDFATLAIETPADPGKFNFKYYKYVDTQNHNGKDFERFNPTLAPDGLKGVEKYLAPRGTVRVTFYTGSTGTLELLLGSLGKVADSPYLANAPIPSGGNFLLHSVSVNQYGPVFKVSSEWMMSELGNTWSDKIYKSFGSSGGGASTLGGSKKFSLGKATTLGPRTVLASTGIP